MFQNSFVCHFPDMLSPWHSNL